MALKSIKPFTFSITTKTATRTFVVDSKAVALNIWEKAKDFVYDYLSGGDSIKFNFPIEIRAVVENEYGEREETYKIANRKELIWLCNRFGPKLLRWLAGKTLTPSAEEIEK
jgi:hypothetical protein